ncbi:MAG: 6-carboxytetrahydropterin synthase QueD [Candidatus Cloacimonetes bacterium]|nr:6-carboxytetrahydropterin synthase QueD [Candidatus Cloacimonadota bacterium]
MYKINVTSSFPGAHKLNHYPGACKNLHGHNWKVRVQLKTSKIDKLGMAIDFGIVKEHLNKLMNKFDHQYLNDLEWFKSSHNSDDIDVRFTNPTSENIARVIFEEMQKSFKDEDITINEVEIWESDNSSVIYDLK